MTATPHTRQSGLSSAAGIEIVPLPDGDPFEQTLLRSEDTSGSSGTGKSLVLSWTRREGAWGVEQTLRTQVQHDPLSTRIDLTQWVGLIGLAVAVGIAYFLAARLSLALLTKPEGVAVFWPAAGVAAGVLIALGPRARWPVVVGTMAATIVANLFGDRNLWSAGSLRLMQCRRSRAGGMVHRALLRSGFQTGQAAQRAGIARGSDHRDRSLGDRRDHRNQIVSQRGGAAADDLADMVRIGRIGHRHGCAAADRARRLLARSDVAERADRRCPGGRSAGAACAGLPYSSGGSCWRPSGQSRCCLRRCCGLRRVAGRFSPRPPRSS